MSMNKRDAKITEARTDVYREMLRAGAFDMERGRRAEFVSETVRQLRARYPELDDHSWKALMEQAILAQYGTATAAVAAYEGRGEALGEGGEPAGRGREEREGPRA